MPVINDNSESRGQATPEETNSSRTSFTDLVSKSVRSYAMGNKKDEERKFAPNDKGTSPVMELPFRTFVGATVGGLTAAILVSGDDGSINSGILTGAAAAGLSTFFDTSISTTACVAAVTGYLAAEAFTPVHVTLHSYGHQSLTR